MSDSSFYDGQIEVNVDSITTLSEPNQQLANAIATGPQDEFFSLLENINCDMGRHYGSESVHIGVTNAWNWKPGTYDKVRLVMNKMLRLNDKAANVTKFLSRTQEHSRWYIDRLRRSFQDAEELKARLKREGYTVDVDIDEYTGKLTEFANKVQEECNKASTTFDNVIITPYIHLSNNERDSKLSVIPRNYAGDCGVQIAWTGILAYNSGIKVSVDESWVRQSWRLDRVDVKWRK